VGDLLGDVNEAASTTPATDITTSSEEVTDAATTTSGEVTDAATSTGTSTADAMAAAVPDVPGSPGVEESVAKETSDATSAIGGGIDQVGAALTKATDGKTEQAADAAGAVLTPTVDVRSEPLGSATDAVSEPAAHSAGDVAAPTTSGGATPAFDAGWNDAGPAVDASAADTAALPADAIEAPGAAGSVPDAAMPAPADEPWSFSIPDAFWAGYTTWKLAFLAVALGAIARWHNEVTGCLINARVVTFTGVQLLRCSVLAAVDRVAAVALPVHSNLLPLNTLGSSTRRPSLATVSGDGRTVRESRIRWGATRDGGSFSFWTIARRLAELLAFVYAAILAIWFFLTSLRKNDTDDELM
jgi:hypothetical protein